MKPTKSQLLFHSKKENLTMGQTSEIYGVSRSSILNLYKKYFIKSKPTGRTWEAIKVRKNALRKNCKNK